MAERIVQLNFKFDVTGEQYTAAVTPLAEKFAALPGLRWKIWMLNEPAQEAGGIYLFENEASAMDFLEGPLAAQVTGHPALSNFTVKQFDVMEGMTAVTRGPLRAAAAAR